MRNCFRHAFVLIIMVVLAQQAFAQHDSLQFYSADQPQFLYTGRMLHENGKARMWMPGAYITTSFTGTACDIVIDDEQLYGSFQNYLEVVVDGMPVRLQTKGKTNRIAVAKGLKEGIHQLVICKNTESGIGYIDFKGVYCKSLADPGSLPSRKIEFIGNSITCGASADESAVPCGKGVWHDQHNAYLAYGPRTARALDAQWVLSSVSGIGLIHSCCDLNITMPQVYDKVNMRSDSILWNFTQYQPDVVTICLGQNDGIQDSVSFCNAYISFIKQVREKNLKARIVCLSSPMADAKLNAVLQRYIKAIVQQANTDGINQVSYYFFSKSYNSGCDYHPSTEEHGLIANELTTFIRRLMNW